MPDVARSSAPIPVFSLQCHKYLDVALTCLPTLLQQCQDPIELIIQDDGTLTAEDCDRLCDKLGPIRIISRAEADDLVIPRLAGKPKCLEYRDKHPFSQKLIDAALLAARPFSLCDGDVFFVSKFTNLDRRSEPKEQLVFMRDYANYYALSYMKTRIGPYQAPLVDSLNAGFLYCTERAFDLDFVEWYIGNPAFVITNRFAEQTVWAALAGRTAAYYFDTTQVCFPLPEMKLSRDLVALHFISPLRSLLQMPDYLDNIQEHTTRYSREAPVALRTCRTSPRNLAYRIVRKLYHKVWPTEMQNFYTKKEAADREARANQKSLGQSPGKLN